MDKQEIKQIATDAAKQQMQFLLNEKYRFEFPVETPKGLKVERTATLPATIYAADLPTSATGLDTGQLYNDSGTIKVVT